MRDRSHIHEVSDTSPNRCLVCGKYLDLPVEAPAPAQPQLDMKFSESWLRKVAADEDGVRLSIGSAEDAVQPAQPTPAEPSADADYDSEIKAHEALEKYKIAAGFQLPWLDSDVEEFAAEFARDYAATKRLSAVAPASEEEVARREMEIAIKHLTLAPDGSDSLKVMLAAIHEVADPLRANEMALRETLSETSRALSNIISDPVNVIRPSQLQFGQKMVDKSVSALQPGCVCTH